MLSRDSILAASDLPLEEVPVPEWGDTVFVRTMSGLERDAFEQSIIDAKTVASDAKVGTDPKAAPAKTKTNLVNIRARLAVKVVCDASGNRLFSDADADALGAKSGKALDRIFSVAQRPNGIGDKDVKELEGN